LTAYSCSPLDFINCLPAERTHSFADFIAKFGVLNPVYFSATEGYVRRPYQGKDHAGSQALHCARGIPHFAQLASIKYRSRLIISRKFGASTFGLNLPSQRTDGNGGDPESAFDEPVKSLSRLLDDFYERQRER